MNDQFQFCKTLLIACFTVGYATSAFSLDEEVIVYKIKTGDTFHQLAQKYMQAPVDTAAVQKANQLSDINRLTVGSELRIPRRMLKHTPAKATVMSISCANPIRLVNNKPLAVGMALREGAILEVPPECHVSLLLEDSSIIRLPSGANLKIAVLRKNSIESVPEVRLDLTQGRIELDVNKNRGDKAPFEVRTPLSVMGVRGTEFRVGYSPDEQSGQVEVLGGLVETRGRSDANSQPIGKGFGVPINSAGNSEAIEKLLPPPTYVGHQITSGKTPSYVVQLSPIPQANYYIANTAATANLSGTRNAENLLAPELFIPRLTKQSVFYQLTSVSNTGLVGTEQYYAFCAPSTEASGARCSAVFDAPLADNSPITFSLSRMKDEVMQQMVQTQNLQARNGRFSVQGLPPGHYHWTLSYAVPQSGSSSANDNTVRQSGAFELIALPSSNKP